MLPGKPSSYVKVAGIVYIHKLFLYSGNRQWPKKQQISIIVLCLEQ